MVCLCRQFCISGSKLMFSAPLLLWWCWRQSLCNWLIYFLRDRCIVCSFLCTFSTRCAHVWCGCVTTNTSRARSWGGLHHLCEDGDDRHGLFNLVFVSFLLYCTFVHVGAVITPLPMLRLLLTWVYSATCVLMTTPAICDWKAFFHAPSVFFCVTLHFFLFHSPSAYIDRATKTLKLHFKCSWIRRSESRANPMLTAVLVCSSYFCWFSTLSHCFFCSATIILIYAHVNVLS